MKKIKQVISLASILCSICLFCCGCATLSYSGEDVNEKNIQTVKTQEEFIFDTYKKSIGNTNIKIGITKTPISELLALYVQVDNLSYDSPYIFRVSDLHLTNSTKEIQFISTNNYLNIWQQQEAASMASMSILGSSITTMAGINTNYNDYNQAMLQNQAQNSSKSTFAHVENIGNQILNHSIKVSSTISPRKSQYFYFFFEDFDDYPINVQYKTLNYKFKL